MGRADSRRRSQEGALVRHPVVRLEDKLLTFVLRIRKLLPHPLIGIVLATLITVTGHSELFLRSIGLIFIALWLCLDIWAWFLQDKKSDQLKWTWGCASTGAVFIVAMLVMWWWLHGALEDRQEEAYMHLSGSMDPSPEPINSLFTFKNGGGTEIIKHRILCGINFVSYKNSSIIVERSKLWLVQDSGVPVQPGGDGQSISCLAPLIGTSFQLDCADITFRYEYALEVQPREWRSKSFRFVTDRDTGRSNWHQELVDNPSSKCATTANAIPDTTGYKTLTVCSQHCDYEDLQAAINHASCGTIVYFEQHGPLTGLSVDAHCDAKHWLILQRSDDPKRDAMRVVEQ